MGTVFGQSSSIMVTVVFLCLLGAVYGGVPTCNTVWEEKCWDEPRQECKAVQKPFTTTQYEQECTSIQVPKVDRVPVPVSKCHDVQEAVTSLVPRQKCFNKPRQVCNQVPNQVCNQVPRQACNTEYRKDCRTEYREVTNYVSEQKCNRVPRQKTEYRTEQECNTVTDRQCKKVSRKDCNYH